MKVHLPNVFPTNFHPQSKVWIYQSNRLFTMSEIFEIETLLEDFTDIWKSHGAKVKGYATILYGQFIVIMADESHTTVGGCSTDSSIHIIKELEKRFQMQMVNREFLAFWVKEKVQTIPLTQVGYAIENGLLTADSLYFNNLVNTKAEMEANWLQPLSESWLAKKYIK